MNKSDLLKAGRYVKATDPVARMKADGQPVTLEALGALLYETDPDTYDRITAD